MRSVIYKKAMNALKKRWLYYRRVEDLELRGF